MNIHKFEFKEYARKLITLLSLALILFLPFMSGRASAQSTPPKWSISAAACVLDTGTTERDILSNESGRVSFRKNKTGTIALICPLSDMTLQGDVYIQIFFGEIQVKYVGQS